jgi:hypothetical protein
MKNAAAALAIATIATIMVAQPPAEARNSFGSGMIVSPTIAGVIAGTHGYSPGYGYAQYVGAAPAIFGYGYRVTYYGNGFSYQPAYYPGYAYARPRYFRGCCRW